MGLDCYVRVLSKEPEIPDREIWYGRKENEIHGWMQRHSNVKPKYFNFEKVLLTKKMMEELKDDLNKNLLYPTIGSFFGNGSQPGQLEETVNELVEIVNKAIDDGEEPYYDSWW